MEGRTFDPVQIESNLTSNYGGYTKFRPAEILREYICCYWISPLVSTKLSNLTEVNRKEIVVPDGCIDILFGSTQSGEYCRNLIVGTMSRYISVNMQHKEIQTFGIRFYPGGIHAFVKENADVFTDKIEMIDKIQQNKFVDLGKRLNQINTDKMLTPYGYIWYMNAWSRYGCFVKGNPAYEMSASGLISGYSFNIWQDLKNNLVIILLSNNDTPAISRIMNGMKNILLGEDNFCEIKPKIKELDSYEDYKSLEGKYICKYTGAEFNLIFKDGELLVDRLWVQEYKRKEFKLGLVDDTIENITFACEVCDGKYVFNKNSDGTIKEVIYISDIFSLPHDKVE